MNIIEAVRNLERGLCEGIKRPQHINFVTLKEDVLFYGAEKFKTFPSEFLAEDWELVEPKIQYEEVEIKAKCEVSANGTVILVVPESEQIAVYPGNKLIMLTGTMKRKVKPKVKHREQIGFTGPVTFNVTVKIPHDANFFAEWSE